MVVAAVSWIWVSTMSFGWALLALAWLSFKGALRGMEGVQGFVPMYSTILSKTGLKWSLDGKGRLGRTVGF